MRFGAWRSSDRTPRSRGGERGEPSRSPTVEDLRPRHNGSTAVGGPVENKRVRRFEYPVRERQVAKLGRSGSPLRVLGQNSRAVGSPDRRLWEELRVRRLEHPVAGSHIARRGGESLTLGE